MAKKPTNGLRSNPSRLGTVADRVQGTSSWRSTKGNSSTARGYTYQWQQYRASYLAEHPLCAIKGDGCTIAATVVDHIKPHRGCMQLFWNPANHQSACDHCHSAHKQRLEAQER